MRGQKKSVIGQVGCFVAVLWLVLIFSLCEACAKENVIQDEIQMEVKIEKEGHFSYREDYGKGVFLSFFVPQWTDEQENASKELLLQVYSENEEVIRIVDEQEHYAVTDFVKLEITGVGETKLRIVSAECAIKEITIPIIVENSMIREEDFYISYLDIQSDKTILFGDYKKWLEFVKSRNGWLNGTVCVLLSEEGKRVYSGFGVVVNRGQETDITDIEITTEQREIKLSKESELSSYEFWCSNLTHQATTKDQINGTRSFAVGIDHTPPINTRLTYYPNAYEQTSTETKKLYGEDVIFEGTFEDTLSGIAYVEYTTEADLGDEAEWMRIKEADFSVTLGQGIYTGVAFRATDQAGNTCEPVELKNAKGEYLTFLVDKKEPVLDVLSVTSDQKAYRGAWTNQPIMITVQESQEAATLSGIAQLQYQYVSIGSEYQTDAWSELPSNGKLEIGFDQEQKMKQNGTYYFRAISNTGLVTSMQTQEKQAVRICLQQLLPSKKAIIEKTPSLSSGQEWYNKKTGVPLIQFAYPEYDNGVISKEYDAPITLHTRLSKRLSEDQKAAVTEKKAVIGITNDKLYQGLCLGEEISYTDDLALLDINFSYDEKSGYAEDGIYEMEYWITDAAGNESEHDRYLYLIDTHEPNALGVMIDGVLMEEDTSQTIRYERFYLSVVEGSIQAEFGVSGKKSLRYRIAKEAGNWEKNADWMQGERFVWNPGVSGCVYLVAEDKAGNQSIHRTKGIVVDNQAPIGENGGKFITVASKANKNLFFRDDVKLNLSVRDLPQECGYSGLVSVSYAVAASGKENEHRQELFSFTKSEPSQEEIRETAQYTTPILIDASQYEGNDTYIEVTAIDRCGNRTTMRETLKIDVTAPKVEIMFDTGEVKNGSFYQTVRTATIHVQELNFDSQGVEIFITKDGEPYELLISEWSSQGSEHTATMSFYEDGDYTMTVVCSDLADNTSEKVCAEPFTIDLTKPVMEITYEVSDFVNEKYVNMPQTAHLTIREHNFREEDFIIKAEPQIMMSEWNHEGDEHSIRLYFQENAHYQFWCAYTDLAGNEAEGIEPQDFYVDTIAPQIVLQGVENDSANAGKITPVIMVYDTNKNQKGTTITVMTGVGEAVPITIQKQETQQGYSYHLIDLTDKEDNSYLIQVQAFDLAGNHSEEVYRFSLNRKGSTYDLSKILPITKRVYNRTDQLTDLEITERNVDRIEEYSIYITRNGKMLSCRETTVRPTAQEAESEVCYFVEKSGDERTGYHNRYIFYQENFTREGVYRITCYSKDRAGNEKNNTLDGKYSEISFVVDNTPPKVIIDGMKEGEVYKEDTLTVHLMVQDNFALSKASFTLVNQAGEELESWDYIELAEEIGQPVAITIPSRGEKQFLLYEISDAAGNEIVLLPDMDGAPKGFLVTTNVWVQLISSPAKMVLLILTLLVLGGGCTWLVIFYFKRNRK